MALISETWEARIVVVTQKEEFFKKVLSSRFEKKGEEREEASNNKMESAKHFSLVPHILARTNFNNGTGSCVAKVN